MSLGMAKVVVQYPALFQSSLVSYAPKEMLVLRPGCLGASELWNDLQSPAVFQGVVGGYGCSCGLPN